MQKLEDWLSKYWWGVLFALSLPAGLALVIPGYYGASDDMHIAWLYEMDRAVRIGQIPPRFVPDLSFGFGYPLFNFLFPLPFYLAEILHLFGMTLVDSIKTLFLLSIPLSAIFMYLLLRQFTTSWLSLLGAVIYIYTPYRATDIYIRGAVGEAIAFVLFPLLTLSVIKIIKRGQTDKSTFRWVGLGSLALASLVLSHNISAYMFLPPLLALALLRIIYILGKIPRTIMLLAVVYLLGLLISIYFWLPAVVESRLMKYDTVFNFADHFPTLKQLFLPYWGYGGSVAGPGDGMSFFLGWSNIVIFVLGVILLVTLWKRHGIEEKVILGWAGAFILMAIFLMNYRSTPFWNSLPLLPYFQFPWRFLLLTTFLTPLLVVSLAKLKMEQWVYGAVSLLIIVSSLGYFHPEDYLGRTDEYFLKRFVPVPIVNKEYLEIQEEYLRLPKTTERRPTKSYPIVEASADQIQAVTTVNDLNHLIKVNSTDPFLLTYNKYFFPGWTGAIDGKEVSLTAGSPFGQITLFVPSGEHQVEIKFIEPFWKRVLDTVSLFGFGLSLVLILLGGKIAKI